MATSSSHSLAAAQNAPLSSVYPALIASAFVNASGVDPANPAIAINFVEGTTIDKDDKSSSVGLRYNGEKNIYGSEKALNKLIKEFPDVLTGNNSQNLVDEWIAFSLNKLMSSEFRSVQLAVEELDSHLTLRTFLVGYTPTVADIAVYGVLRGNVPIMAIIKKGLYINVQRWFNYMDGHETVHTAGESLRTQLSSKKKVKATSSSNYDIGLPDTENGVVVRFPPEPSGFLHIGHAKAAMLNQYIAQQYNGKMIIRFDDTNPSKEKEEYQEGIMHDLALMGIKGDKLTYTSDYFQELYDYCVQIIKSGKAYCDDTEQQTMRTERMEGIESKRRNRTVEENLRIFTEEMAKGTEEGVKNCVRAKIDMSLPNKALRDPVIYRCNPLPHHRTADKWKVYPTYDFCCPIVDSIEGITHALRTVEYRDRNDQYAWMLEALGLRKVHVWDFSRLNFIKTLLSKRKLAWFVGSGLVNGWDDPRLPTVQGIRRRGLTIEGLRQFIIGQGPSKNTVLLDWTIIWSMNKKIIDAVAPRHTAMFADQLVTATISGAPEADVQDKPKHKKNPDVGTKKVHYSQQILIDQVDAKSFADNEEITLMDWGNAIVEKIEKDANGNVTSLAMKLHLEGDFKKTEKKVTWLSKSQELVDVELVDFDYLITKDKLEEDDKLEDFVNKETEFRVKGIADYNVKDVKEGDIIQFERKGYYRCDKPSTQGTAAVFFNIPTGKQESAEKKK